jgi:hypothetical protein
MPDRFANMNPLSAYRLDVDFPALTLFQQGHLSIPRRKVDMPVIPAEAGIQVPNLAWTPAFAGVTVWPVAC